MAVLLIVLSVVVSGCNRLLGIDDVTLGGADASSDASGAIDAADTPVDARSIDARSIDASGAVDAAAVDAMLVTEQFGFFTPFAETTSLPANIVIGRKISVTAGSWRLLNLAYITHGGGGDVAMGLYTNSGSDEPGQSIGFSAIAQAGVGVNELDATGTFDTTSTGTELWVMMVADASVPLATSSGLVADGCSVSRAFGATPLPAGSFGAASCAQDDAANLYIIVTPN